ncbi:MAG: flagellar assembly protein FliW [Sporolactobacillus sp.]
MQIKTRYFGEQDIDEAEVITFPNGLPGFDDDLRFVLQPFGDVFSILQSADHADVCFVVTNPFLFFKNYSVELPDTLVTQLGVSRREDVAVLVIVTVHTPFAESTANFNAPVVINTLKRVGCQYIPDRSQYSVREPLAIGALTGKA